MTPRAGKIFLSLLLILAFPGRGLWAANLYLAQYHKEFAQHLLSQGQLPQAANEFIFALTLNPRDRGVIDQLDKFRAENLFPADFSRVELTRVIDTAQYIAFMSRRVEKLVQENQEILEFIQRNSATEESLMIPAQTIAHDLQTLLTAATVQDDTTLESKTDLVFADVWNFLARERDRLRQQLDTLNTQNDQLRSLKLTALQRLKQKQQQQQTARWEGQHQDLQNRLAQKEELVKEQQTGLTYMETKVEQMEKSFTQLQERLKATDQKVTDLTHQMAGVSLELYDKDKQLLEKKTQVASLSEDLSETQQRLTLVQRIIQEKDQQIETMKKSAGQISGANPFTNDTVSQRLGLPPAEDPRLAYFAQQISELNSKYQHLEKSLHQKDETILSMQTQLVAQTENLATSGGVVQIYKERLQDALNQLRQKDAQLNRLQRLLGRQRQSTTHATRSMDIDKFLTDQEFGWIAPEKINLSDPWSSQEVLSATQQEISNLPLNH